KRSSPSPIGKSLPPSRTSPWPDALTASTITRYGQITQLMKLAIAQELNSTSACTLAHSPLPRALLLTRSTSLGSALRAAASPFTLFREDSLGTKFLSTYAREK